MNLDLQDLYLNSEPEHCRQIQEQLTLPFLPIEDLENTFTILYDGINEDLIEFAEYIEIFYVRGRSDRGRRRAVPPS